MRNIPSPLRGEGQGEGSVELPDLKGLTPKEIERFCVEELGQKAGQGLRLATRLFRKRIGEIDALHDLNGPFREALKKRCTISSITIEKHEQAEDGTGKLLYRLDDGNAIEGVLIPGPGRLTLCVSTQVGCASGCGFCLTGSGGLIRNLTAAEMVNQVFAAATLSPDPVTNIVLMGTGEPLSNYASVRTFLEILSDRHGMGYSPRKTTISTCGLAPMIEKLADDYVAASLALSLNATTDEVRSRLMPVNSTWPIARLLQALHYYDEKNGQSVTIEYILLKGVNDSDEDARRLGELLAGLRCMVNILLFNPYPGAAFERPEEQRAYEFRNLLLKSGLVAVVRSSRGRDISAACGQLRSASTPASAQ